MIRDKTNFLAVWLFCGCEFQLLCNRANFGLFHRRKRKKQTRQNILSEPVKHIGLITFQTGCFLEQSYIAPFLQPGVMSSRNQIIPKFVRCFQKRFEFYRRVAADTRIRGPSNPVFLHKIRYNLRLKAG